MRTDNTVLPFTYFLSNFKVCSKRKRSPPIINVYKTVAPIANSLLKWCKFMFNEQPNAFAAPTNYATAKPDCIYIPDGRFGVG